jgi:hypothetical protein
VQQVLGALGLGNVQGVQIVHAERPPAGQDPIDRLERLVELRKGGVLTDEEFEQQKHRILAEEQSQLRGGLTHDREPHGQRAAVVARRVGPVAPAGS